MLQFLFGLSSLNFASVITFPFSFLVLNPHPALGIEETREAIDRNCGNRRRIIVIQVSARGPWLPRLLQLSRCPGWTRNSRESEPESPLAPGEAPDALRYPVEERYLVIYNSSGRRKWG